jgi:3-mercaptopyruvate sulfurtransferase SseA
VQILNEKGITNAAALVGGTQAWQNAGYPMESSGKTDSTQNKNLGNTNASNSPAKKETKPGNN